MEHKLDKGWANSFILVEVFMKGGSTITKRVGKVEQFLHMEMFTMGSGKKVCRTVKEFILGMMVKSIKDNS